MPGWLNPLLTVGLSFVTQQPAPTLFVDSEKVQIMAGWRDRYSVSLPKDAATNGPWQVRQTVTGSKWLLDYARKLGESKRLVPTQSAVGQNPWDQWISKRYAMDAWLAGEFARSSNEQFGVKGKPAPKPAEPGPIPSELLALAGNPPPFLEAVTPRRHSIRFADGLVLEYNDSTKVRDQYAYYRFHEGVMSVGKRMKDLPAGELDALCKSAGIDESAKRVMQAVSLLEGGFDSVNTYDTGFVSVGFIQFACLTEGGGSLGDMLALMKKESPDAFRQNFRQYGLEVSPEGLLIALDLSTGAELVGPDAAAQIIRDKRLISVFQRAGLQCREFRVAQLRAAKQNFYPADDIVTVTVDGVAMSARVGDIFRSEAGMATMMDRKVNRGKLDPLQSVLSEAMNEYGIKDIALAYTIEAVLIPRLKYRKDALADPSLSKPKAPPMPLPASRDGGRGGRKDP